jgi:hypothetical protein
LVGLWKGGKKMEIENPIILGKEEEPDLIGYDIFDNAIYTGDEILVYYDDVYLKEELSTDAVEILKRLGCEERVAVKE